MTPGRADFSGKISVSRETMQRFDLFAGALVKWNPSINLVARSTLPVMWTRHFLDSAQLWEVAKIDAGLWLDIGAGGGFPGLVMAIMGVEKAPKLRFILVESDARKSVFLQTVVRNLDLKAEVLPERIEQIQPLGADILSARALAPLTGLLEYADRHLKPKGHALFMKGAAYRQERDEALEKWSFRAEEYPSITDGKAVVLKLGDIARV